MKIRFHHLLYHLITAGEQQTNDNSEATNNIREEKCPQFQFTLTQRLFKWINFNYETNAFKGNLIVFAINIIDIGKMVK